MHFLSLPIQKDHPPGGPFPFLTAPASKRKGRPAGGLFWSRIRESIYFFFPVGRKQLCHARPAGHEQMSTGHLQLIGSTPSLFSPTKKHPPGCFFVGAGYGSRTRLHGLGSRCITDIRILRLYKHYSKGRWKIQPLFVEGISVKQAVFPITYLMNRKNCAILL